MNKKNTVKNVFRIGLLYLKYLTYLGFFIAVFTCLQFVESSHAQENNIFGIHLATVSQDDLKSAGTLVNSNGGTWGYVTVVIQENDRNQQKWQEAFDNMRDLKLIPIVRIATQPEGDSWKRPRIEDAQEWARFLNSLRWVVRERYIVLFNEPNHAQEWGGEVDPHGFATISAAFAKELKAASKDNFVMLAGFDAAAPMQAPTYYDEAAFFGEIKDKLPEIFQYIDGLASHSYPNPGFSGSPFAVGRNSIRNYEWELQMLKDLGITKNLPVFITETGWKNDTFSPATITSYTQTAYTYWEQDLRVRAATPFILNYQAHPFLSFSWQKPNASDFYPHYYAIQNTRKVSGAPEQIQAGSLQYSIPQELLVDSMYEFKIHIRNDGQAIWRKEDGYHLDVDVPMENYSFTDLKAIKPGESQTAILKLGTSVVETPAQKIAIALYKGVQKLIEGDKWDMRIYPLPDIVFKAQLFPRIRAKKDREFEIQLFDDNDKLIFKKKGIKRLDGRGFVSKVKNVYIGGTYRMVILTKYYLPRQEYLTIQKDTNIVQFKPLLPLDFNNDGHWSWEDSIETFKNPKLLGLFLP